MGSGHSAYRGDPARQNRVVLNFRTSAFDRDFDRRFGIGGFYHLRPRRPVWDVFERFHVWCLPYFLPMAFSPAHRLLARMGSTSIYKRVWRYWYPLMTRGLGADKIAFLNWAYEEDPPIDLTLEVSDEPNRDHINMYHRTATHVELSGKRVLEVSCGHGGGASYLTRTLHPASYTGLDLNRAGIKLCQRRHNLPGLDFVRGDAENLPFEDESFDVVLNVEASHCYPHFSRFLAEVVRVLRPGGYLLYTDLRPSNEIAEWEADLAGSPLRQLSQREINAEVVRGIEKNSHTSRVLVDRNLPAFLRFADRAVGRQLSRYLEGGELSYRMYCFTKDFAASR
ncbi:Phthiotriol/phenolphthiotriol dimycocerosates methyltransferase [Mycobacterium marinum]|nr:Phthiotriol/phenolphthiotriol dimycocerosates methyltransferase [Mycobacterium marinum]AXN50445.1 Phthiotriol/phenolphthiotriol dimycocerosates methyltransferase [Mycobacterium marinum]RFZ09462.1 Phthiotriol/phenolphthiotriol dimycocerosates methyltransferase [Mycobacterium marinum]RFZ28246.1 Phthiotriol/phenolphthiotriol dimycocerosates methyltransferase [Mycobacterium marinum]RFZ30847.1 Phthiotriol/phenolphthiotriol dimycocerosates methyltransferase [Mycobacterium marinum]